MIAIIIMWLHLITPICHLHINVTVNNTNTIRSRNCCCNGAIMFYTSLLNYKTWLGHNTKCSNDCPPLH